MNIKRLEPPIKVDTPKGSAFAIMLIDYTSAEDAVWCCVIRATGEFWWYRNHLIRHAPCDTWGIRTEKPKLSIEDIARFNIRNSHPAQDGQS